MSSEQLEAERVKDLLCSYLHDGGWHTEAQNVLDGIDSESYEHDIELITWMVRHLPKYTCSHSSAPEIECQMCSFWKTLYERAYARAEQAINLLFEDKGNEQPAETKDEDICQNCGGYLDTGFECNDCGKLQKPVAPRVGTQADIENVARAIWNIRREVEDRCDIEVEDLGKDHSVWLEARAALESIAPAQQEPAAWINSDNLDELKQGGPRQPVFGKQHLDVDVPLYTSPQPTQPSVPVDKLEALRKEISIARHQTGQWKMLGNAERLMQSDRISSAYDAMGNAIELIGKLIAAHDGKGE